MSLGRASGGAGASGPQLGPGTTARLPGGVATAAHHRATPDYQPGKDQSEAVQHSARAGFGEEIEDGIDRKS
ncbi:unnamed protein product [Callosobruchus maculatus]|uniref:Uncharacterized protein n=1 Tax=Callosobruchus maculatus TaxID=64391 RepID=A0A653DWH4_CALMS|nr:unnamed protein product [Callosobruchus maculatus]